MSRRDIEIRTIGLIHFQRVDRPVRLLKSLRVVLNEVVASVGFRRARAATPRVTRPISTEGRIEDDLQIVEMAGNIAVALEMREWLAPAGRFGRVVLDIGRDGSVGEEPDVDGGVRPFCCVDATAVAVKSGAVGVGVGGCNLATDIVALVCSVDVAVVG